MLPCHFSFRKKLFGNREKSVQMNMLILAQLKGQYSFDLTKVVSQELPIGYSWQLLNFKGKGKLVFILFKGLFLAEDSFDFVLMRVIPFLMWCNTINQS